VGQRSPVGYVRGEHPAGERPPRRLHELDRGQVGWGPPPGEHVRDHHIEGAGPHPLEHRPGVPDPDPDPDPAQREPAPDQVHQRGIDLDGQLRRAWPGHRHVPG
jgi:hypothetical protein